MKSKTVVRIGVIGLGHMGGYHASICMSMSNVHLVAVADSDVQALQKIKLAKVRRTTDFTDWLEDVDGVIIAVPTSLHYQVAKKCLEQGKHVLLEKPLTKTIEEAEELFDIAVQRGVALHVGHVERFNGAVQEMKKKVHTPYLIESHRIGPFSPRIQHETVVLDLMIHDLDIILSVVHEPLQEVQVMDGLIHSSLSDIALVQLKFQNGVLANIISSRASHIKKRTMSIHQKKSFMQLDFTTQDIVIHHHASDSVKLGHNQLQYTKEGKVEHLYVYKDNPLKCEINYFVRSIETGKNKVASKIDLDVLRLALQIDRQMAAIGKMHDSSHSRRRKSTITSL